MLTQNNSKIGLIAGGGDLPERVIAECLSSGRELFVIAIGKTHPPSLAKIPHISLNIASVGRAIKILRKEHIKDIVFAGGIQRPNFASLRPDAGGMKLLGRISKAKLIGDNSLLSIVIKFFEDSGFNVLGVEKVLNNLLMPLGTLGKIQPNDSAAKDIAIGTDIARAIGNLDIGQCIIIQHGVVLGVEAVEGTDALIRRCSSLQADGHGGILVKMKKPVQDSRIDLPTIGVHSIINAAGAGLRGLAVEAGGAIIIDRDEVARKADELGLFVVGV